MFVLAPSFLCDCLETLGIRLAAGVRSSVSSPWVRTVVGMSTKPIEPDRAATPEVVVENLRAAVYASHEEISVQVQADGGLDSKLLGLLGFFALAGSILVTVPHGLSDRRGLLLAGTVLGALVCLVASVGGSIPKTGPLPRDFYAKYGAAPEPDYFVRLLDDLTANILRNRQGLALRSRALVFAVAAPIVLTVVFGLLTIG